MSFSGSDKTKILRLKSSIASYYSLQMKKIGDRQLEALFYENCVISGGAIASLFHDEPVSDIDLYAKSDSNSLSKIKDYIIHNDKNIKSVDSYELEDSTTTEKKQFKLVTQNAVTLINDVQFIYMNTWENCKKNFDFVHCMAHYDLSSQKLYISESQYNSIKNKTLVSSNQVEIKAKRLKKYFDRGWNNVTSI